MALLLLAPLASAAAPVRGEAELDGLTLVGSLVATTDVALLDLSQAFRGEAPVDVAWASARGVMVTYEGRRVPITGQTTGSTPQERAIALGAGGLGEVRCSVDCSVLFVMDAGRAVVSGQAQGAWGSGAAGEADDLSARWGAIAAGVRLPAETTWSSITSDSLAQGSFLLDGRVRLLLWGATATVVGDGTVVTWETGERVGPDPESGGLLERVQRTYVVVDLEDASVSTAASSGARVSAPAFDVALEGELAAGRAVGHVVYAGKRVELTGQSLAMGGLLQHRLRAQGDRVHAVLGGHADEVRVDGAPLETAALPATVLAPPAAAGGLLLVGLYLVRGPLLTMLYSRIAPSSVLENQNRKRLYELVVALPGSTVTSLVQASGLSQVVVRHHLRMLEANGCVVTRSSGKARLAFPVGAGMRVEAAVTLRDPTRTRVAEVILRGAGVTQNDVIAATGLRQRLVSYHIARLEEAGLVHASPGRPRRFEAATALREALS